MLRARLSVSTLEGRDNPSGDLFPVIPPFTPVPGPALSEPLPVAPAAPTVPLTTIDLGTSIAVAVAQYEPTPLFPILPPFTNPR